MGEIILFLEKILFTLLTIIMCRLFIIDSIQYFKEKKYWKVVLGIILIIYFLYNEYKILIII